MKTIIHDFGKEQSGKLLAAADQVICADGRYAPCQGCFKCWTKHPAACEMKDALHQICRVLGNSADLTIITENLYGGYSPAVKNILDRSIGSSTPLSTYRGRQMHHVSAEPGGRMVAVLLNAERVIISRSYVKEIKRRLGIQ